MSYSSLLFSSPSFLEGFGRALDAGGTMIDFNNSLSPRQADYFAMYSDWMAVGKDLARVISEHSAQVERESQIPPKK